MIMRRHRSEDMLQGLRAHLFCSVIYADLQPAYIAILQAEEDDKKRRGYEKHNQQGLKVLSESIVKESLTPSHWIQYRRGDNMEIISPRKKQRLPGEGNSRHMSIVDNKSLRHFHKKYGSMHDISPSLSSSNVHGIPKQKRAQSLAYIDTERTSGRRGSLLEQKESAMLGENYSQKLLSLKQTLAMMGQIPPGMMTNGLKGGPSRSTGGPPGLKGKATFGRTISKKKMMLLDDLGIIAEDTDSDGGLLSYRGQMSDSDSSVGLGTSKRSLHARHRKRRARLGAKFRRLAKFLTIFFGLWKVHALKVKNFLDTYVDLIEINEPVDLMFDVTEYKADKQACVSQETKRILKKNPAERTKDEVKYVQVALRNYSSIAEYPIKMTRRLAEKAWYEIFDRKRIIVQQTHPARCFYFILSGSVVVSKMDEEYGVSRTVCFLNRGEHFGELGLINNAPRQATVISKETVELLVINDEDYVEIFMGGGLKGPGDYFIEHLWCFEGWPIDKLTDHPSDSFLSYFKRNMVLVRDSKISDWIYIVKSGSCTIIKKLVEVSPEKKKLRKTSRKEDKEDIDAAERHRLKMDTGLNKAKIKTEIRSLMFRQKELAELRLGVEMMPVEKSSWEMDLPVPVLEAPEFHEQSTTNDNNHISDNSTPLEAKPKSSSDNSRLRKKSLALILDPKRKNSLSGPFLQSGNNTLSKGTEKEQLQPGGASSQSASSSSSASERKRKRNVIRVGGSPTRKLSSAVLTKAVIPNHPPTITEEGDKPAKVIEEDEITQRIRQEFDTIINSDSKRKRQPLKEEKKTILDELNKDYLKRAPGSAPEDLHPMFVRVQTLTKGSIFGLADLVHEDQPSFSLVSNGAECVVIKKKFYQDNCKPTLINKIRQEISPYPAKEDIQANLQTYVNWVDNKEKAMNEAMLWNKVKNIDVHNARSTMSLRDSLPPQYKVSLA